jgi:hypothetical protein
MSTWKTCTLERIGLQVEPYVAIYNQYLELIFMAMYEAVDSFEKKA